jgi:hypothetical protein
MATSPTIETMASREFDDETERRLLANDPTLTGLPLCYPEVTHLGPRYSQRVGRAIASSTHLTKFVLELDAFQDDMASFVNRDIDDLNGTALQEVCNYISSSSVLTSLHLTRSSRRHLQSFNVLRHFFAAINERVPSGLNELTSVTLNGLDIEAEDIASLIRNGGLANCVIFLSVIHQGSFDTEAQAVRHVAESFAVNTSLTSLTLGVYHLNETFICGILEALQSRRSLDHLKVVNEYRFLNTPPTVLIEALAGFIRSSTVPSYSQWLYVDCGTVFPDRESLVGHSKVSLFRRWQLG